MKVALVHDFLVRLGGAERVLKVLAEMFPTAPIHTLFYDEARVGKVFDPLRVKTSFLQDYPGPVRRRYRLLTHLYPRAVEEFDFSEYDLVISSNTAYSHGIITNTETKHLCYMHSPMRYAWDWTHQYEIENNIGGLKALAYRPLIKSLRQWDFLAADRPDKYLANSETVAGRISKYYRMESDVVYPPVDVNRFEVTGKNEGYFLIVSTLTPYKKIDLAVQLFNKIGRRLIVIGDGNHRKYLESIAGDNIDFLGFKSDEVVKEYMENCRAFIFPGEEDFGITPVEAMACGKPVLAFGKGGCTETIVSGRTGEFFFEPTVEAMEDGLGRLLYNEKYYKPETIRRHAEQFSRENFEKKVRRAIKAL